MKTTKNNTADLMRIIEAELLAFETEFDALLQSNLDAINITQNKTSAGKEAILDADLSTYSAIHKRKTYLQDMCNNEASSLLSEQRQLITDRLQIRFNIALEKKLELSKDSTMLNIEHLRQNREIKFKLINAYHRIADYYERQQNTSNKNRVNFYRQKASSIASIFNNSEPSNQEQQTNSNKKTNDTRNNKKRFTTLKATAAVFFKPAKAFGSAIRKSTIRFATFIRHKKPQDSSRDFSRRSPVSCNPK